MSNIALLVSLIVPVVIGLVVLRLGIDLLFTLTKQGAERARAVQRSWSRYLTAMFLAAFFLPFLRAQVPINTTPIWILLIFGGILAALHNSSLANRSEMLARQTQVDQTVLNQPVPERWFQTANEQQQANTIPTVNTALAVDPDAVPDVQTAPPPAATEGLVGKLPPPQRRTEPVNPLSGDRAESWYERQWLRLGQVLQGEDLAAARLRLSVLKSMLLLGQMSIHDADADVNTMLLKIS